jgi:hypothetical protein
LKYVLFLGKGFGCFELNTARLGFQDFKVFGGIVKPEQCQTICQEFTECRYWTFNSDTGVCFLKVELGKMISRANTFSGKLKKIFNPNVIFRAKIVLKKSPFYFFYCLKSFQIRETARSLL